MANKKVLHKRSNIEGKAPSTDQLDYGELAINYNAGNEQLYIKNSANTVVGLISQGGGGDITSVTASGTSPLTLTSATSSSGAVTITGSVDLSDYATTSSVPTKTSDLTNDSGFITSSDIPATPTLSDLGGVGSVSASGTSPLTLSASKSGTVVTITGSVDSYTKEQSDEIRKKIEAEISTATGGGITSVDVSGTSPLTLEGSVSDGVATITGSVDLSDYQKKLKYYEDLSSGGVINSSDGGVLRNDTDGIVLGSHETIDIIGEQGVDIETDGHITLNPYQGNVVITTSNGKATYNGYEIATVDDLDAKQDKLKYYSEANESAGIDTPQQITINAGTGVTIIGMDDNVAIESNKDLTVNVFNAWVQVEDGFYYNDNEVATVKDVNTKQDKLTAGDNISISGSTISATDTKYWNYYLFEGGGITSTVTIDGSSVSVPANTIVEGNFTTDITAIGTNNLKRIIIRGDVSLNICTSSSSSNTTLEEIDLEFSKSYSRSFDYMFHNLRGLKRLRVVGGQATGARYMCYYVGSSTNEGCEIDIKGMDFSQMTSSNGAGYMCYNAKIASIDLSGHTFSGDAYDMFRDATVGSADVSGCTFSGGAHSIFYGATVGSADVSGCTFGGDAYDMFYYATVNSADVSGCTFSGDAGCMFYRAQEVGSADVSGCTFKDAAWSMFCETTVGYANVSGCTFEKDAEGMFYQATVNSADVSGCTFSGNAQKMFDNATVNSADVSGCTFNDSGWGWMFYSSTITNLNLSGCDLSGLSVDSSSGIWNNATINSINLNGVTLPTTASSSYYFMSTMNSATKIGAIFGDFGEMSSDYDFTFDNLELRRESTVDILSALEPGKGNLIFISQYSYNRLTDTDTMIATSKGWTVSY